MTKIEVVKLMELVALEFKGFDVSPSRVELWLEILQHRRFDDCRKGVIAELSKARGYEVKAGDVNDFARKLEEVRIRTAPPNLPPSPAHNPEIQARCKKILADCVERIGKSRG